jgi:integrase
MTTLKAIGGSVWQEEATGKWRGRIIINGKRVTSPRYEKKAEARAWLQERQREVRDGVHTAPQSPTLRSLAADWLKSQKPLQPNTLRNLDVIVRLRIGEDLHNMAVQDIKPMHIQRQIVTLLETLHPNYVRNIHETIRAIFAYAISLEYIAKNPCDTVQKPRMIDHEFQTLSEEQCRRLIDAAQENRYGIFVIVALQTGMRLSELRGLTWPMVNFDKGQIRVAKNLYSAKGKASLEQLKTRRARRVLPMNSIARDALTQMKAIQQADQEMVGEAWKNPLELVFTNEIGIPLVAATIDRQFDRLLRRLGLPDIRIHDLRHTFATLMIERGANIKVVSELLGHANVEITLRRYVHVTNKMHESAREHMESLFQPKYELHQNMHQKGGSGQIGSNTSED